MSPAAERRAWAGACGLLAAGAFAVILRNGFFNYDDPQLIVFNERIRSLGPGSLLWMVTTRLNASYQPLGHLANALIRVVLGPSAWGWHAASLLVHGASAGLLLLVCDRLLEPFWKEARLRLPACFTAAALWAVHPIHVHSVAWATGLSDLLASALALASLLAWLDRRRGASLGLFCASLLCRWKAIPLPAVFLLLDVYPLRRRPDWREKLPFFGAALAAAFVNAWAKAEVGFSAAPRPHELLARLLLFPWKFVRPTGLSPIYALEGAHNPLGLGAAACALLVLAAAVAAWALRRRWPALPTALAAYALLSLPPGLSAQKGPVFAYDYHAYLALAAFAPLLAAGLMRAGEALAPGRRAIPGCALAALIPVLAWAASSRASAWKDSEGPWREALAADPFAYAARNNLAAALLEKGLADEALQLLEDETSLRPEDLVTAQNLAGLRANMAKLREGNIEARHARALAAYAEGRFASAEAELRRALALDPSLPETRLNLALALQRQGRRDEALTEFQAAARLKPSWPEAHSDLGSALAALGRAREAEASYREALRLDPGLGAAREGLRLLGR